MPLYLRLKGRSADAATVKVALDDQFYSITDLISIVDDCIYHEVEVALLTKAQDTLDVDPRKYAAIAVLEEA